MANQLLKVNLHEKSNFVSSKVIFGYCKVIYKLLLEVNSPLHIYDATKCRQHIQHTEWNAYCQNVQKQKKKPSMVLNAQNEAKILHETIYPELCCYFNPFFIILLIRYCSACNVIALFSFQNVQNVQKINNMIFEKNFFLPKT